MIRSVVAKIFLTVVLCISGLTFAADQIIPLDSRVIASHEAPYPTRFSANFEISPSSEILDVLRRGIPLTFVLEVSITKDRWYWTDKKVSTKKERMRLSFNPLTRQYRISLGSLNHNFESLDQALQLISSVNNWLILEGVELDPNDYEAKARFYLDTSRLPKPLQVSMDRGPDWSMDTGWFNVKIIPIPGD